MVSPKNTSPTNSAGPNFRAKLESGGARSMIRIVATVPAIKEPKAAIPRALDENLLLGKARSFGLTGKPYSSVASAFEAAKSEAHKDDLIFISGSNFTVAEIL